MRVRILTAQDVREVMPMGECIAAVRRGFATLASGGVVMPLRQITELPVQSALLGMMPGWLADPACFGAKVTAVYPHNHGTGFGSHQGVVLLFDPEHGSLTGIVDGGSVTALRTAAASAIATDLLARSDATELAILGYGEQARAHADALSLIRTLRKVKVWGRDSKKTAAFADSLSERLHLPVNAAISVDWCVKDADIICTVTAAAEPILFKDKVKPGTHVNAVGSSRATELEIDIALFITARVFADYVPGVIAQGSEYLRARAQGLIEPSHLLGSVAEVMTGAIGGRRSAQEITLFKSLGIVVEDLVTAHTALHRAEVMGRGVVVDF